MSERMGARGFWRFGMPGVLLGVSIAWLAGSRAPEAEAQTRVAAGGAVGTGNSARPLDSGKSPAAKMSAGGDSSGTLAMITNTNGPAQLLYIIDTKSRAFAVYSVDPTSNKGVVKLQGSRQYQWDLLLEHYNNQAPEPDAIKATVKALIDSPR